MKGTRRKKLQTQFLIEQIDYTVLGKTAKLYKFQSENISQILNQKFEDWRGRLGQVDDVSVVGIRL